MPKKRPADENREFAKVCGPKVAALRDGLENRDEFAARLGMSTRALSDIVNKPIHQMQLGTLDALAVSLGLVRDGRPDRQAIYQKIGVEGGSISVWWARMIGDFLAQSIEVREGTAQALGDLDRSKRLALAELSRALIPDEWSQAKVVMKARGKLAKNRATKRRGTPTGR